MNSEFRPGVEIVEVGLRDGLQSVPGYIATERKVDMLRSLHAAGLRRIEVTSFTSTACRVWAARPVTPVPTLIRARSAYSRG